MSDHGPADSSPGFLSDRDSLHRWLMDELGTSAAVSRAATLKLWPAVERYIAASDELARLRLHWDAICALQYSLGLEADGMMAHASNLDEEHRDMRTMLTAAAAVSNATAKRLRKAITGEQEKTDV